MRPVELTPRSSLLQVGKQTLSIGDVAKTNLSLIIALINRKCVLARASQLRLLPLTAS